MEKDDLFQTDRITEDFVFNERVAEVFDDMLDRSVPFYDEVIKLTAQLLKRYLRSGDNVYDLGCSTGTTLLEMVRRLQEPDISYVGVDKSAAMIKKAELKKQMYSGKEAIRFVEEDITDLKIEGAGAVICNYTLQFIRPLVRPEFVKKVYRHLRPGGILIISEKTICSDPHLNRDFIELYHDFKKTRGYSELEIAKKREALENVLIPFSIHENIKLLQQAGFSKAETFFQWLNYASFIAVK